MRASFQEAPEEVRPLSLSWHEKGRRSWTSGLFCLRSARAFLPLHSGGRRNRGGPLSPMLLTQVTSSSRPKPGSRLHASSWTPAFAGVTLSQRYWSLSRPQRVSPPRPARQRIRHSPGLTAQEKAALLERARRARGYACRYAPRRLITIGCLLLGLFHPAEHESTQQRIDVQGSLRVHDPFVRLEKPLGGTG